MGSLRVGLNWATSLSLSCIGEGNGNPLQCSCLENPRDRGAWWAAVYGVTQSRTQLKWLSSSSNYWNSKEKLLGKTLHSYEQLHFCNENPHVLSEHSGLISNMTRPHSLLGSSRNPFPWFGNKSHFPEVLRKIMPTKTPLQAGQPALGLKLGIIVSLEFSYFSQAY